MHQLIIILCLSVTPDIILSCEVLNVFQMRTGDRVTDLTANIQLSITTLQFVINTFSPLSDERGHKY